MTLIVASSRLTLLIWSFGFLTGYVANSMCEIIALINWMTVIELAFTATSSGVCGSNANNYVSKTTFQYWAESRRASYSDRASCTTKHPFNTLPWKWFRAGRPKTFAKRSPTWWYSWYWILGNGGCMFESIDCMSFITICNIFRKSFLKRISPFLTNAKT